MRQTKLFSITATLLALSIGFCSCGGSSEPIVTDAYIDTYPVETYDSEKQDALLKYLNRDIVLAARLEEKLIASYSKVTGTNYTDDLTMYNEFTTKTLDLARELSSEVSSIVVKDPDILAVHSIYNSYATKYLSAIAMLIAAIEAQDVTMVVSANELMDEANTLAVQYYTEMLALAEEYGVELEEE